MEDCEKTKQELIAELEALREQVRDLKSNQGTTGQGKEGSIFYFTIPIEDA
ncbi:MAG: hypothetical protein ACSI46_26560 [Gloeotrichia echinulata DVL01]|jgi:hypothetical protein|nr:hypothetical protein [Gloeotrichia echinulata DEX184]